MRYVRTLILILLLALGLAATAGAMVPTFIPNGGEVH